MVDRLPSYLKQILKINVTMLNNGVGRMCATAAEASVWMHLTIVQISAVELIFLK